MEALDCEVKALLLSASCRRLLVAFSGGLDSCVLAALLCELSGTLDLRVELAYFNHRLRGAESEAEERFCRAFAGERRLPLHVGRWVEPRAGEAAARDARYRWLAELAGIGSHEAVLTAHHRKDQAETVLLRLLRGTGWTGLQAMARSSVLPTGSHTPAVRLLRPLLGVPRERLHEYARSRALRWFDDSSNLSGSFLRNRVRHELLPLLEELRPGAEKRLAALARHAREERDALETLLNEKLESVLGTGPGWATLPRHCLRGTAGVGRRLVLGACTRLGLAEHQVAPAPLRELLDAARADGTRQRRWTLGPGTEALLLAGTLVVLRGPPWVPAPGGLSERLRATDPAVERQLDLSVEPGGGDEATGLWIRTRQRGERLGPGGPRLKELFIERGVARFLRARYPLVEDEHGLLEVPGLWRRSGARSVPIRFGPSWPAPLLPRNTNR